MKHHRIDPVIYHAYNKLTQDQDRKSELFFALCVISPVTIGFLIYLGNLLWGILYRA
jgi:hypothetical protein